MTHHRQGGRRRFDRVLDPAFVEDLSSLSDDDLRARRDDARAEEREVSYTRRLLQGRLDLLRTDLEERRAGRPRSIHHRSDEELVVGLTAALAHDPPRTASATASRYVDVEAPDHEERRRAAEAAVADVRTSDPSSLSEDELVEVVARLQAFEVEASATRRDVIAVLDTLTAEAQRRVAGGTMPPDAALA